MTTYKSTSCLSTLDSTFLTRIIFVYQIQWIDGWSVGDFVHNNTVGSGCRLVTTLLDDSLFIIGRHSKYILYSCGVSLSVSLFYSSDCHCFSLVHLYPGFLKRP